MRRCDHGSDWLPMAEAVARNCGYGCMSAGFAHMATASQARRTDPSAFSSPVPSVSVSGDVPSPRTMRSAVYCSIAFTPLALSGPGSTPKYDTAPARDSRTAATTPVVTAVAMLVPLKRRYHLWLE